MANNMESSYHQLSAVRKRQQDLLLGKENVVGVGVGRKHKAGQDTQEPCLIVYVSRKVEVDELPSAAIVPEKVDDTPTDIIETGELFAGVRPEDEVAAHALQARVRPVMGGFSVGHPRTTSGTIGAAAYEATNFPGVPRKYFILSNNHVLSNSNEATVGDPIYQPGQHDGGTAADSIGRLHRFIPIRFDGEPNRVDAAIAEVPFQLIDRGIYWIGHPRGIRTAEIDMLVQKTGRTTHYTTGKVTGLDATVRINYSRSRVATMEKQIVITPMSEPGDSGSLICDFEGNAVGLLFAGSNKVTIANDIQEVQSLLDIRVV